ncbi:MAG: IS607 family transposase [Actinomycetota bacterium]|nr:IS607 family transposase [Actinomycetota bacterium]
MFYTIDEIREDFVVVNGERIKVDPPFETLPDKQEYETPLNEVMVDVVKAIGNRAEIETLLSVSDGVAATEKDVALYARVSTQKQAENLTRQHERLFEACGERGYRIVLDCSEITSGLNDNRHQFFKIVDAACKGGVKRVVVERRDRFTRFGFRTIERFFNGVGCTVEVLEKTEDKSEHEELVENILTMIVSFSSRIYEAHGGPKRKVADNAGSPSA